MRRSIRYWAIVLWLVVVPGAAAPAGEPCVPGTGQPLCDGVDTDCDGLVDDCDQFAFLQPYGKSGIGSGEILSTWGLTRDSAGNIYAVDSARNNVQVFDEFGVFLLQFGSAGSGPGQFDGPTHLALDLQGNIYVSDRNNWRVQKFDPQGNFLMEFSNPGGAGSIVNPWGIAVDAQGNLYVCADASDRIVKFDAAGNLVTSWGGAGSGPGQFFIPIDVEVAPDGTVYVADFGNSRIQHFDADGQLLNIFGSGSGGVFLPAGIDIDPSGTIHVSDWTPQVSRFDLLGNPLGSFAVAIAGDDATDNTYGVTVDDGGAVFVSGDRDILKFDANGVFVSRFALPDVGSGEFYLPHDAAVDGSGNVYVLDAEADKVVKFDRDGEFITEWELPPIPDINANYLAIGPAENVYVSDRAGSRVLRYDSAGQLLTQWAVNFPRGIDVDGAGNVFVINAGFNRVQVYDGGGALLDEWVPGDGFTTAAPQGLAVGPSGRVYITDTRGDTILVHDSSGAFVTDFGPGALTFPTDVDVAPSGHIFVADGTRIAEFDPTGAFVADYAKAGPLRGVGIGGNGIVHAPAQFIGRVERLGCRQEETWFLDNDADDYGQQAASLIRCDPPEGYAADDGDCDDSDPQRNPGENELCDGFDNDCDGLIDDTFPGMGTICGEGVCGVATAQCSNGMLECSGSAGDTDPPILTIPDPLTLECNGLGGVQRSDPATQAWLAEASAFDECGDVVLSDDAPDLFPVGVTTVTFVATDEAGNSAIDSSTVTIADSIPPEIAVSLDQDELWPPNHRMVDVVATASATDVCSIPTVVLTSISSSEPDNGEGDGDTVDDIQGAAVGSADFDFQLRAERAGGGQGRSYTITYTAGDNGGNTATATGVVFVPHDRGGVVDPVEIEMGSPGVLSWSEVPGAVSYSLVRGNLNQVADGGEFYSLGSVTCIDGAPLESAPDPSLPEAGEVFFYVVEYTDTERTSYGSVSADKPRSPESGDCE